MTPTSPISLRPLSQGDQGRITQLYRYLELFSEGTPPRNSLFVFAPGAGPITLTDSGQNEEQLLIIDPPTDVNQRFRLGNQIAALFTVESEAVNIPLLSTVAGGIAHLRIGDHFLDIYSQQQGAIVHLPALGLLCGGDFGSNATVPHLAKDSDGSDELETLRLLARLIKQQRLSLYLPRVGDQSGDKVAVMERLAGDVAYLHALRRAVTPLALRREPIDSIQEMVESILPRDRSNPTGLARHRKNVSSLVQAVVPS